MSMRSRKCVWLVVTVLLALAYTRVAGGWDDVAFFAGLAGVVAFVSIAGNVFTEFAPDGALRRERRA
jgi:hypothetical protein